MSGSCSLKLNFPRSLAIDRRALVHGRSRGSRSRRARRSGARGMLRPMLVGGRVSCWRRARRSRAIRDRAGCLTGRCSFGRGGGHWGGLWGWSCLRRHLGSGSLRRSRRSGCWSWSLRRRRCRACRRGRSLRRRRCCTCSRSRDLRRRSCGLGHQADTREQYCRNQSNFEFHGGVLLQMGGFHVYPSHFIPYVTFRESSELPIPTKTFQ